ncbi:MAG: twin-arginine translocase TatA/TatE family subunit [Candidatus Eisenbacteria bacterium]
MEYEHGKELHAKARCDLLLLGRIGTTEIILIVVVILILFGARRIPELMRSLGSGVREFKKGAKGEVEEEGGEEETRPDKDA